MANPASYPSVVGHDMADVSHRWIARKENAYPKRESEFAWVELEQDDERVAEFMNNIILLFDDSSYQS